MRIVALLLFICPAPALAMTMDTVSLSKADSALSVGDYEQAIRIYNLILEQDPSLYGALFGLAHALAFSGKRTEAILAYSKILDLYPRDPDARLGRGRVFAWEGQYAKAESDLRTVAEDFPDYADVWSALGDVYLWSGNPDRATAAYTKLIDLQPGGPTPYIARAKAHRDSRRFSWARDDLQSARLRGGNRKEVDRLTRLIDRIPGATPWEGFHSYEFQSFTQERPVWHTYSPSVRRDLPYGSVRLIILRTTRFSKRGQLVALDSYFDLWRRSYGNFYLQTSANPSYLPKLVYSAEIFQGLGKGWELSAWYRYMGWVGKRVGIYGASVAKYVGDWYLRERTTFVPEKDGYTLSIAGFVRRYFATVDDFLEVGVGTGKKLETSSVHSDLESKSLFISVRLEKFVTTRIGLVLSGSYEDGETTPTRRGLSLGIKHRW